MTKPRFDVYRWGHHPSCFGRFIVINLLSEASIVSEPDGSTTALQIKSLFDQLILPKAAVGIDPDPREH